MKEKRRTTIEHDAVPIVAAETVVRPATFGPPSATSSSTNRLGDGEGDRALGGG